MVAVHHLPPPAACAAHLLLPAENAFTAGMVTGQQLQHAATFAAASHTAPPGRLMPLIEGKPHQQQQPEQHGNGSAPGGPAAPSGIWRRVFSAPDAAAADAAVLGGVGAAAASSPTQGRGGSGGGAAAAGGRGGGGVGGAVARLLGRLPGGRKLEQWVRNGRSDSWRKQQEQLQRDKYDIHQVCVCVLVCTCVYVSEVQE